MPSSVRWDQTIRAVSFELQLNLLFLFFMKVCPLCNSSYSNETRDCFVDGTPLDPAFDLRVGTTIASKYFLEDVIGEGGTATVYKSKSKITETYFAVKIIKQPLSLNEKVRERFRREAEATKQLAHPNIVEFYDYGYTDDNTPYIAMEMLSGRDLRNIFSRGRLELSRVLPILVQVAQALSQAHDFGITHRDLKPENIFLCSSRDFFDFIKLLDFGMARSLVEPRLTNVGEIFGTPEYMAPERFANIDSGNSADFYSFGVIFFEAVTGHLPFRASDIPSLFAQHSRDDIPLCRTLVPTLPATVEKLICRLLAKKPLQRPQDAHQIADELIAICKQEGFATLQKVSAEQTLLSNRNHVYQADVIGNNWSERLRSLQKIKNLARKKNGPDELSNLLQKLQTFCASFFLLCQQLRETRNIMANFEVSARNERIKFGNIIASLGVETSKARLEEQQVRERCAHLQIEFGTRAENVRLAHREVMHWEGRCALSHPCHELAVAYRTTAENIEDWIEASRSYDQSRRELEEKQKLRNDFEIQLEKNRNFFTVAANKISEKEKTTKEQLILKLIQKIETLEMEMTFLIERCCDILRTQPDLQDAFEGWDLSRSLL